MHCCLCDRLLTDFESTRRNAITGEFLDMCNHCFQDFKDLIPTRDRKDLISTDAFDDEPQTDDDDS